MAKQYKLDIKEVLENIDKRNFEWFSNLKEEEKDAFEPFIVMQFLSSANNYNEAEYFLTITNEVLNKDFAITSKNKDLFYRLCCVCGLGKKSFHPFMKPPKGGVKKVSLLQKLVMEFIGEKLTDDEIEMFVNKNRIYGLDFWIELAESLDWSDSDIKTLEKDIKKLV